MTSAVWRALYCRELGTDSVAHALLPLKDLPAAKTRLAGILSPAERRTLMQAMARDVLAVLSRHPELSGVTLVSDDPGAAALAARYSVEHLSEQSLGCRGLNAVLSAACDRLTVAPGAQLIVLHADLPFLQPGDIQQALELQRQLAGLLIGTDSEGRGTNLLAFAAGAQPQFYFGADSCAKHLGWARQAAMPAQVLQAPGIARDVDQPADLQVLLQASAESDNALGQATRAVLSETKFAAHFRATLLERDIESSSAKAITRKDNCGHDE